MMSGTAIVPSLFIAREFGTPSLGQFAMAASTICFPTVLIGNAIGQVYYQRAAQLWAVGDNFASLWRITAKRLIFIGLPIYATLVFLSPWLYPIVFGASWVQAGEFASLLSISAFFSFITSPLDRACLVVHAWKYIPAWHAARLLTTGLVAWLSWFIGWAIEEFLQALVLQMSILYLIDYVIQCRFASLIRLGDSRE